jgi:hypothetical protein
MFSKKGKQNQRNANYQHGQNMCAVRV